MKMILAFALALACAAAQAQQPPQRSMRCSAVPVCPQKGASCKGVQKTYTGAAVGKAKDSIVQACVKANRGDRCNCIQQCREAAQCIPSK